MKNIIIIAIVLLLVGCGTFGKQPRIDVEYQEVLTPVSNVPMPPDTTCPKDALVSLNSDKVKIDGEVAKAYRIAVLQLRECSELRQKVLDKYREIATQDAKKIDEVIKKSTNNGPFGSGLPTAEAGGSTFKFSTEEQQRQLKIDSQLRHIENEFDDLVGKEYDIDELEI